MSTRHLVLLAGAVAALGLAGFGFGLVNPPTPPTDGHKTQPAPKSAPSKTPTTPREKEKASSPAKPEVKPAPVAPADDHETPADKTEPDARAVEATAAARKNESTDELSADEALRLLREGNERWISSEPDAPHTDSARRSEVAKGQKPFATILTCSDSRLPVERLFDRGVGDVFVVRVAGNVMSPEIAGTIEYGAEHLNVPLLVVMGHTKCGAVAAAAAGGVPEGNVASLVEKIVPAVERAKKQLTSAEPGQLAAASVKENVWQGVFDLLRSSSQVRHLVHDGKLKVVGAVCDISTGKVEWMGPHPWQDALVDAFEARNAKKTETVEAGSH
jgi:carbonic anhydrase